MGSSGSKHLLEVEPKGVYFKNSPTWGHFLMLKSDTTLFKKEFLWYPKLERVLFHTTEGTAFNYCKIQARERPKNTKEKSPLLFTLRCLWTAYEPLTRHLSTPYTSPLNHPWIYPYEPLNCSWTCMVFVLTLPGTIPKGVGS